MILVGSIIQGFAGGYFGRDSYEDRRVEAVGVDWVVARGVDDGAPQFADGATIHEDLAKHVSTHRSTT